jgi:hypothetical protein
MKLKVFVLLGFLFLFRLDGNADNKLGLTNDIYISLCGVWDTSKEGYGGKSEFSWGKAAYVTNRSIVIDLGADDPSFFAGMMGTCKIIHVSKKNKDYSIDILFRNNKKYTLDLTVINDKTIYFHDMDWFSNIKLLPSYGEKNKYFRIAGPKPLYYKPKIDNLRLRFDPSLKGSIIRNLNIKDKMLILMRGKKDTIEGSNGNWVKVLTDMNEIGWCFDAYLDAY